MKMKTSPFLTAIAMLALFFAACKKDKINTSPGHNSHYRIKKIQNGAEYKNFTYDNQNRLYEIGFNGGFYRIIYTSPEIKIQSHFTNGDPDPTWKYLFTVNNNRVNGGFRYLPNGAIGRDYLFEYDNDGRLQLTVMRLYDFSGDVSEEHRYTFDYDDENNLMQVQNTRENKVGSNMVKADSVSATFNYYTSKGFITWKQTGFDVFGKVSGGIQLSGLEIIPFSFLFLEGIITSEKAVQSIDTKKFLWNPGSNSWGGESSDYESYPETDYKYDDKGLLTQYKNINIEWEPYE